jgi:hypothetical protein
LSVFFSFLFLFGLFCFEQIEFPVFLLNKNSIWRLNSVAVTGRVGCWTNNSLKDCK